MVHYPLGGRHEPGWEAFQNDGEHDHEEEEVGIRLEGLEDVSLSGTVGAGYRTHFEVAPSPVHRDEPVHTPSPPSEASTSGAAGFAWVTLTLIVASGTLATF